MGENELRAEDAIDTSAQPYETYMQETPGLKAQPNALRICRYGLEKSVRTEVLHRTLFRGNLPAKVQCFNTEKIGGLA
jgi:hypothetical protein